MKKNLPSLGISNELAGASAFFAAKDGRQATRPPAASEPNDKPTQNQNTQAMPASDMTSSEEGNSDSTLSRNHAITHANNQDSTRHIMQGGMKADELDEIRKLVKQLGKELSTHRFTAEEKKELADIVYTCARQGIRTSENEITRIAVNWLLIDYRQNGANSVLARLLERLHR